MQHLQMDIVDSRYELRETLGSGGMGTVYKALDLLSGQQVALKYITKTAKDTAQTSQSSISDYQLALTQEFRTLGSLRHPNIISVYDYGFDDQQAPYYTMEFVDTPQTIVQAAQPLDFDAKINLIMQMLQAIEYLHRRGVLHRDVKPDNVLVNSHGVVKVMDFGLAVEINSESMHYSTDNFVGTLSYTSPEQFNDQTVSRSSDLWSVGVVIYEILTGIHPFKKETMAMLINSILNASVDISRVEADSAIKTIIMRLLEKDPSQRYSRAQDVLRDLYIATNRTIPPETQVIRESYLKAARFVGRETEFNLLKKGLDLAKHGQGSAFLVGGESGVGKSRLIDELRIYALVRGFLVLRGQATTEHAPFELWREALQRLSLHTPLNDTEASLLKGIVPDIDRLLRRSIPPPPASDDQTAQLRLHTLSKQLCR